MDLWIVGGFAKITPQPESNQTFTIDDIHKIRGWNYERQKDMTVMDRIFLCLQKFMNEQCIFSLGD